MSSSKRTVISCIGDSLTEGDYGVKNKRGIKNVRERNYPRFLAERLGAEVRNFGHCGATASTILNIYREGKIDVRGSDVIVVMLGTNGGNSAEQDTQCNRDYMELLALIVQAEPQARIVLCTPPHATADPKKSNCGYMDNVLGATAFARRLSKERNLPLIDVFACPYFTAEAEDELQPNDGLHFSEKGYLLLAEYIAAELGKIFPELI